MREYSLHAIMMLCTACLLIFALSLQNCLLERYFFGFWVLGASEECRREHGSCLVRLETASELKIILTLNLSGRRLYKLEAKISGHAKTRKTEYGDANFAAGVTKKLSQGLREEVGIEIKKAL